MALSLAASASPPRSNYELNPVVTTSASGDVAFVFSLVSTEPLLPQYWAKYINISVQLGPQLSVLSSQANATTTWTNGYTDVNGSTSFYLNTTASMSTKAVLNNDPSASVFAWVNVTVTYTDYQGDFPRTIYRTLTFPIQYAPPGDGFALLPAALAGLGGAGLFGAVLIVTRRARLEELYLMHDSGMLIRHWSRKDGLGHDSDIMSGMLVVLQEFVRDSWRSYDATDGSLEELRFGPRRVVLARSEHVILAAVVQGRHLNGLPRKLREAVDEFERSHADVLENWNGNVDLLSKADAIGRRFLHRRARVA